MARPYKYTENAIDSLCKSMESKGYYKDGSINKLRLDCKAVCKYLGMLNPDLTPMNMTSDDVIALHKLLEEHIAISTQRNYMFSLKHLCEFLGNRCFNDVTLIYGQDIRPNADWLTPTDAESILHAPKSALEDMIIWLALCHGLRKVEIIRLRMGDIDIHRGFIKVTGKGRGMGKIRYVHCHPRFYLVYDRWMKERKEQESRSSVTTDALLTWNRYGKITGYNIHSVQSIIMRIIERTGIRFSCHTLRRTFGRELWRSGVKITTIANILGHESIEMTIKYLGINLDDQAEAMQLFTLGKE